jgi:hypothetical protein
MKSVTSVSFDVSTVWAAACAAQRVNGRYIKQTVSIVDPENPGCVIRTEQRNRDIMMQFLENPDSLTADDLVAGEKCRKFLQNDLTFRALKGRLTDFDSSMSKVLAIEQNFDTVKHRLELAVVACLPASHSKSIERQHKQEKMKSATGGYIASPGAKVAMDIEIVGASYSQQYNIWWTNGINEANQPVFFSYKNQLQAGLRVSLLGTVKAHRDDKTQLTRVKIV